MVNFLILLGVHFCFCFNCCCGGKVLIFVAHQGGTHRRAVYPLAETMERKGHKVTLVAGMATDDKTRSGKITEERLIFINTTDKALLETYVYRNSSGLGIFFWKYSSPSSVSLLFPWRDSAKICQSLLEQKSEEFEQVLSEKWDLVIISDLFTCCSLALTKKSRAPYALFSPNLHMSMHTYVKNFPTNHAVVPTHAAPIFVNPDSFFTRTGLIVHYFEELLVHFLPLNYLVLSTERKIDSNFSLIEFFRNSDISIVDFLEALDFPRPRTADSIKSGSYCSHPRSLPKNIQTFISNPGSKGTILMGFGTAVHWGKAPPEKLHAFLQTMKSFSQYRILFQYQGPELPKEQVPPHVMVSSWLPQADILAHPKTRVFLTHGGMKSIREALCNGVPLVIMPFFAEQYRNARTLEYKGAGVFVDKITVNEETLVGALDEVLNNEKFARNAERLRTFLNDQPMSGLEYGAFWTDFVIRHRGLPKRFYVNQGKNLYLFQFFMLDVIVSAFCFICLSIFLCYMFIVWYMFR